MSRLGSSREDLLRAIAGRKKVEGWGTITFRDASVGSHPRARVTVRDSFEARGYGRSAIPVCHFLRGYLAGVLSVVLTPRARKHRVELVETMCAAKGDEHCEFQTPRESVCPSNNKSYKRIHT